MAIAYSKQPKIGCNTRWFCVFFSPFDQPMQKTNPFGWPAVSSFWFGSQSTKSNLNGFVAICIERTSDTLSTMIFCKQRHFVAFNGIAILRHSNQCKHVLFKQIQPSCVSIEFSELLMPSSVGHFQCALHKSQKNGHISSLSVSIEKVTHNGIVLFSLPSSSAAVQSVQSHFIDIF